MSEALVDTRKGDVLSEHPVEVKMLQGTLNANRLEVVDSGDLVRFGGGVDMMSDAEPAGRRARQGGCAMIARLRPIPLVIAALFFAAGPLAAQPRKGHRTPCRASRRTAISRSISRPRHWKSATRTRWRPSAATCSVTQGDTGLRCKSLVVFYEQNGGEADKSKSVALANPGPGGQQRIKKLEARGGVVVTQKAKPRPATLACSTCRPTP